MRENKRELVREGPRTKECGNEKMKTRNTLLFFPKTRHIQFQCATQVLLVTSMIDCMILQHASIHGILLWGTIGRFHQGENGKTRKGSAQRLEKKEKKGFEIYIRRIL